MSAAATPPAPNRPGRGDAGDRGGRPTAATRRRADPVRVAAFEALSQVTGEGAYANLAGPPAIERHRLVGRDAALATELINGTCRAIGSYELIIEAASGRDTRDLDPDVVDVLCLGTHQLLATRIPSHAAISTTVDLARTVVGERVAGLVNAVLRKIDQRGLTDWLEQLADGAEESARIGILTQHPDWIADAYVDLLGPEEARTALEANNTAPSTILVARPGLSTVDDLVAAGAEAVGPSPLAARWSGNPADLPMVRDGRAGVQDPGSQLVALALGRAEAPTGPWLDLCAGPGGKTALLTGLANARDERLVAIEPTFHRADLVAKTARFHRPKPLVLNADGRRPPWSGPRFARALADVPCSGLGALRRRAESRWRRSPDEIDELTGLQTALLHSALDAVVEGGVVAYVTCSPHRAETSQIVERVLTDRHDVTVEDAPALLPEVTDAAVGSYLQLWPHRHGTDAMFLAVLRRGRG